MSDLSAVDWKSLPVELFALSLSYLNTIDRLAVLDVCHSWRENVRKSWTRIERDCCSATLTSAHVRKMFMLLEPTSISLHIPLRAPVAELLVRRNVCSRIVSLTMNVSSERGGPIDPDCVVRNCYCTRSDKLRMGMHSHPDGVPLLAADYGAIERLLLACTSLLHFEAMDTSWVGEAQGLYVPASIWYYLPRGLRSLTLSHVPVTVQTRLLRVHGHLRKCFAIPRDMPRDIPFVPFPELTTLRVGVPKAVADPSLALCSMYLVTFLRGRRVKRLTLPYIDARTAAEVGGLLPELTELVCYNLESLAPLDINCPNVESFTCWCHCKVRPEPEPEPDVLASCFAHWSRLRSVRVTQCSKWEDRHVAILTSGCPLLEECHLYGNTHAEYSGYYDEEERLTSIPMRVSPGAFQAVLDACKNMKSLWLHASASPGVTELSTWAHSHGRVQEIANYVAGCHAEPLTLWRRTGSEAVKPL